MKIKNVKGCYDFAPNEQKIKNYICDTLKEVFQNYGFNNIETPILCYYNMLSEKYNENDDILKEIYKLTDQGNRKLGLRYDLTVPFAKYIALNKNVIQFPFKRYEISKVFRNGPIKKGRDREFTQCDVDVVGIDNQLVEVELLNLFNDAFKKLKINIVIKFNNMSLIKGLIIESGIELSKVIDAISIVDKIEKTDEDGIFNLFKKIEVEENKIYKLIDLFKMSLDDLNKLYKDNKNELIKKGLEEVNNLNNYINSTNLNSICVFTPSLARAENYYTGNVFEVYNNDGIISSSIGAGGRYNNMITDFINDDKSYPAVGISFGLSSIYEILKIKKEFNNSNIDILIIPLSTEIESINLATKIRNLNIKVNIDYTNKKLKKSLNFANKNKIPYVIILGEDEIKNQKFELKNMETGNKKIIEFNKLEDIKKAI